MVDLHLEGVKKRLILQMWDTAGCEKYRSMTVSHTRGALGAIVTYDITDEISFLNCEYWVTELKKQMDPYSIIALCANKVDITHIWPGKREVMPQQAEEFAKKHDLLFLGECSALDNYNVRETINAMV